MKIGETFELKGLADKCPFCTETKIKTKNGMTTWLCGFRAEWTGVGYTMRIVSLCERYDILLPKEIDKVKNCICPTHLLINQGCKCGGI